MIHADSLTVLRQMEPESVDAIIVDPPYGIDYRSTKGESIKNDKAPFIWWLYDAYRVLKPGESGRGTLACFTRWDVQQVFIDAMKIAGFIVKNEVIWDKVYHGMEETYGKGNKPRGYGTGNYKSSGKVTVLRDDYESLLAYCKAKGIPFYKLDIPSVVVSYANDGDRTRIDELRKVKFNKRSNKAAQGDKSIKVDLDLMIFGGIVQDGVEPV